MKRFWEILHVILVGALLFSLGFQQGARRSHSSWQHDSTSVQVDSTIYQAEVEIPADPKRNDSIIIERVPVPIPADVDSQAVFQAMFEKRKYQVQHRDSNIVINFRPTVSENRLIDLDLDYQWLRPVAVSHYSKPEQCALFIGAQIGSMFAGPSVDWQFSDKWMLGASYSIINTSSPVQIRVQYKIWDY